MMYWYGHGMGGWGFVLMAVSNLVFWGLLIVGVAFLVRYLGRTTRSADPTGGRPTQPEQLLAERYGRGDIDEEEYRRRLDTLRANPKHRTISRTGCNAPAGTGHVTAGGGSVGATWYARSCARRG